MADNRNSPGERESRRILERISRESESGGRSVVDHAVSRARNHISGADANPDDWVEHWGTRIGRLLGVLLAVGLILWLAVFVLKGG